MIIDLCARFFIFSVAVVIILCPRHIEENKKKFYVSSTIGIVIGIIVCILFYKTIEWQVLLSCAVYGMLCAQMFGILCEISNHLYFNSKNEFIDNEIPPKYYITGDKHRNFERVKKFCREMKTRKKDVLIILGDTGFNYYDDIKDDKLKSDISALDITLFCLHGNKENRPQNVGTYGIRSFCGGKVLYEPKYPNILFAIDGEIYTFEGRKYMVVGGAHSVDKMKCLESGDPFWNDEMPDDEIKLKVENRLLELNYSIYGMLTHTCPIDYLPTEMFMSTRQNATIKRKPHKAKSKKIFKPDIDRSTEEWLGKLEKALDYQVWFCGHYHIDKEINKITMLCHYIRPLHLKSTGEKHELD